MLVASIGSCAQSISNRDLTMVDPTETRRLLEERKSLLGLGGVVRGACVDPRGESAFVKEHIPGAVHLPFERVSTDYKTLKAYDVLIVYGDDYNDPRAIGMSKRLMELGFKEVRTLRGGVSAWKEAGYEVATTEAVSPRWHALKGAIERRGVPPTAQARIAVLIEACSQFDRSVDARGVRSFGEAIDGLNDLLAQTGLKSTVDVRTPGKDGAVVCYHPVARRDGVSTAPRHTNDCTVSMTIGIYNIWTERNNKATSRTDREYDIIESEITVDIEEVEE